MKAHDPQFENDPHPQPNEEFKKDLKLLYMPHRQVPPEVDRKILELAHQQLPSHRRDKKSPRLFYWASAAAAVLAIVLFLPRDNEPPNDTGTPQFNQTALAQREDIDGNGTVDILDAYHLARSINETNTSKGQWDFNGDGLVNDKDVDAVAYAAVRLKKGVL